MYNENWKIEQKTEFFFQRTKQISEDNNRTKRGQKRKKHKETNINSTAQNLVCYLETRTCEPYSIFKHGLLAPYTESLLKTHYTQTNIIFRYIYCI